MKVNLYAVYDVASGIYDGPVPANADGTAIRNFSDMAMNAESPIGKHPSDFTLFRVGIWNDGTGTIESSDVVKLINGLEAVSASRVIEPGILKENGEMLDTISKGMIDNFQGDGK